MATKLNYICDTCQAVKGVANKWWVIRSSPVGFFIDHFSEEKARAQYAQLACSSRCLNQSVSVWCESVSSAKLLPSE